MPGPEVGKKAGSILWDRYSSYVPCRSIYSTRRPTGEPLTGRRARWGWGLTRCCCLWRGRSQLPISFQGQRYIEAQSEGHVVSIWGSSFAKNWSTCEGREESLRIISLPLLSWAVTTLRTGGSVVWDCGMIRLDEGGGGGTKPKDRRDEFNSLIYSPWWNLRVNSRNRRTRTNE